MLLFHFCRMPGLIGLLCPYAGLNLNLTNLLKNIQLFNLTHTNHRFLLPVDFLGAKEHSKTLKNFEIMYLHFTAMIPTFFILKMSMC